MPYPQSPTPPDPYGSDNNSGNDNQENVDLSKPYSYNQNNSAYNPPSSNNNPPPGNGSYPPPPQHPSLPSYNNLGGQGYQKPENYFLWGILTTILCCLPFGIISIIQALRVDSLWNQGQTQLAVQASASAKRWAIISAVTGLSVMFLSSFFSVLGSM